MRLFLFIFIVLIITPLVYPDPGATEAYPFEEEHREGVFVHTDRDFYVAGEYINYHVYLLDGQSRETRSGFAYLALRRADEVVERVTIPLEQGHASGSIYLSDTLSTGQYGLTAYTNWMRNQGENSYFNKPVSIVNRFDDDPLLHLNETDDMKRPDLSFTAEGGHFVEGIDNNILVKANIQSGLELREVWIRDLDKDTVAHTQLDGYGTGGFTLNPEPGNAYHAILQGEREEFAMPEAVSNGCALKVYQDHELLAVHVLRTPEATPVDWLRIQHQGTVWYEERVHNRDQTIQIAIDKELPAGFLSIEAVGRDRQVIGRRLWYNEAAETSGISLSTNKDTTGTRESIQLTLDATAMKDEHANVSLAVVPEASVNKEHIRFDGYIRALRLADTFGIPTSEVYTRVAGMDVETLNRYLITLSDSGTQPAAKKNTISANDYYMETDKLILCGKVVDRASKQAVSGARVVINTPDTLINMLYTESRDDGSFYFVLPDFYHNKSLYFYADPSTTTAPVDIKPEGKFTFHDSFRHSMSSMPANRPEYLKQSQEIVRINKAFDIDHMVEANQNREEEEAIPPLLYSRANQTIDLDNYFPLDSLSEIAREIVHSWRLRLRGGEYVSQLTSATTGKTLPGSPVHFVDGIITGDIHKMAQFDSEDIDKIEVHNYHWVHGEMVFPGIIGIFTEDQLYSEIVDDRTSTSLFSESLRDKLIHTTPDYGPETSHTTKRPDFRQLISWESGLELRQGERQELTFYTGDLGGDYMIILQGLSDDGHPVYQTKSINVQR